MIDHVSIAVSNLVRSASFHDHVLQPLGPKRIVTRETTTGCGKTYPEFWLNARTGMTPVETATGSHVCLRAPTKQAVIAFDRAALDHGGASSGAPGEREAAVTTYFGAFIHDPVGDRIEAVTFPRPDAP